MGTEREAATRCATSSRPCARSRAYTLTLREAPVKINQNENPWDLPEARQAARARARAVARPWSRYPDFDPHELLEALARFSGWRADGILAGNGSNEMIEALLLVTVGQGTRVVIPEPTFTLYALMTTILGGEPVRVPAGQRTCSTTWTRSSRRGGRAGRPSRSSARRTTRPAAACRSRTSSGCATRRDSLVVIDEAYHEFAGESAVPLLERHPNLVVLRTFSKAMALAGLRVGYLLASPELVREVEQGAAALQRQLLLAGGGDRRARGEGRARRRACGG